MKKIIAFILMAAMLLSLTACAKQPAEEGAAAETVEIASSLELLNNVWAQYADDEKFSAAGGDASEENMTMDGPGKFGVEDKEMLDVMLALPASAGEKIDDAASLMHMMNANTFTAGAFRVTDSANVEAVVKSLQENIQNRQWMCGFPEKVMIAVVGDYVVMVFGLTDVVDTFQAKLTEAYSNTEVKYAEALA